LSNISTFPPPEYLEKSLLHTLTGTNVKVVVAKIGCVCHQTFYWIIKQLGVKRVFCIVLYKLIIRRIAYQTNCSVEIFMIKNCGQRHNLKTFFIRFALEIKFKQIFQGWVTFSSLFSLRIKVKKTFQGLVTFLVRLFSKIKVKETFQGWVTWAGSNAVFYLKKKLKLKFSNFYLKKIKNNVFISFRTVKAT
jgi:hypothetical protein